MTENQKSFYVGDDSVHGPINLQQAFLRFQKKKQRALQAGKSSVCAPPAEMSDPDRMWRLRMLFVEQVKRYVGVPYARKNFQPHEDEYHAEMFLDCCGLIRRAVRDLEEHFRFRLGPWNQGYMFDLLPEVVCQQTAQPGDLVFIQATYFNPKKKKQKHDVTHVEMWLGDGEKTVGARWNRGKVQVFESYKFESTSYHSMKYIFRSIDTWLRGTCKSFCPEHQWKHRRSKFCPGNKSVFADEKENKRKKKRKCNKGREKTSYHKNNDSEKDGRQIARNRQSLIVKSPEKHFHATTRPMTSKNEQPENANNWESCAADCESESFSDETQQQRDEELSESSGQEEFGQHASLPVPAENFFNLRSTQSQQAGPAISTKYLAVRENLPSIATFRE